MGEVFESLNHFNWIQYTLAFVFIASYALALGSILSARSRRFFGMLTVVSAIGLMGFTRPWEHGALLVACAIIGMGGFIGLVWLLSVFLQPRQAVADDAASADPAAVPSSAATRPSEALLG